MKCPMSRADPILYSTIADRFVILSHGEKVGDFRKDEITMEQLEHMIVTGRSAVS